MSSLLNFYDYVEVTSTCWYWKRSLQSGYGRIEWEGRVIPIHRFSYLIAVGDLIPGMQIDHVCHSNDKTCNENNNCMHRRCVNPAHLEQVTPRVNVLRSRGPTAANAVKTHCVNGHPFDKENTEKTVDGRRCSICNKVAHQKYDRKVRLARHARGLKHRPYTYTEPDTMPSDVRRCDYGHVQTPESVYIYPNGRYKECRACRQISHAVSNSVYKHTQLDEEIKASRLDAEGGE
jgi:hypothetical protein